MVEQTLHSSLHVSQLGCRENLDRIRKLSASMESFRETIMTEGMSRDVAQALEQINPGVVTERARINSFTRYPSNVNRSVGLEAVNATRSKGVRGLIVALIGAAIGVLAAFGTFLVQKLRGKAADQRNARAKDRLWKSEDAANVGGSRPEWRDDLTYRAALENFANTITVLLVDVGAGTYRKFLNECFNTQRRGLFDTLTDHIDSNIALTESTVDALGKIVLMRRDEQSTVEIMTALEKLRNEVEVQFNVIDQIRPQGLPGNGLLSDRLVGFRNQIEQDAAKSAITRDYDDAEIYSYRSVVDEAQHFVQSIDANRLMKTLAEGGRNLQKVMNTMDVKLITLPDEALECMTDTVALIHQFLDMQTDLIAIIGQFVLCTTAADDAYCQLLRAQIAAMESAGINFTGNEPEFADERQFYRNASRYLD